MNKSTNPSSIQSKKMIFDSLIDLMQIKNFDDITVSEISENADVVRRTFYRNFDSKKDVLDGYLDMLIKEYTNRLNNYSEITYDISLEIIFKLCKENKDFFLALKKNNLLVLILEKWSYALPIIHSLFLNKIKNFPPTLSEESLNYLLSFNVGGTFNVLIKWINDGMVLDENELTNIITKFMKKCIE